MRKLSLTLTAVALLGLATFAYSSRVDAASADSGADVLDHLPLKRMTVELRQVTGKNLFKILADISQVEITTDACVAEKKVDLKMKNAPVRWVFAAAATQLDLRYAFVDGRVHVECMTP